MCGVDFIKYSSQYLYSDLSICLTMYIIIFLKRFQALHFDNIKNILQLQLLTLYKTNFQSLSIFNFFQFSKKLLYDESD